MSLDNPAPAKFPGGTSRGTTIGSRVIVTYRTTMRVGSNAEQQLPVTRFARVIGLSPLGLEILTDTGEALTVVADAVEVVP